MPTTLGKETHRWESAHCTFAVERPACGVVVLRIAGHDVGEFGAAPMREVERHMTAGQPIDLFIDARHSAGASIEVSGEWAQWLATHRSRCGQIRMLTGSRLIEITADFVRRFAGLREIMRIGADHDAFDAALAASIARARAISSPH